MLIRVYLPHQISMKPQIPNHLLAHNDPSFLLRSLPFEWSVYQCHISELQYLALQHALSELAAQSCQSDPRCRYHRKGVPKKRWKTLMIGYTTESAANCVGIHRNYAWSLLHQWKTGFQSASYFPNFTVPKFYTEHFKEFGRKQVPARHPQRAVGNILAPVL